MTRVNASVRASELSNSMLFAEYREIKHIPNSIKSGKAVVKDIPPHLFNDWRETTKSRELLKERINKRLTESKQTIRFYDRIITLEEALIK